MSRRSGDYGALGTFGRFVPPSHRLFALFNDLGAAQKGVDAAMSVGELAFEQLWYFNGETGAKQLDPYELARTGPTRWFRLFIWVFSNNVEYLSTLADAVRQGQTAVAVLIDNEHAANQAARWFWSAGAGSFAYTIHGNYVPVML